MELADAPKNWIDGVLEELEYWRALQNKKKIFLWVHCELAERAINFHLSQIICEYSDFYLMSFCQSPSKTNWEYSMQMFILRSKPEHKVKLHQVFCPKLIFQMFTLSHCATLRLFIFISFCSNLPNYFISQLHIKLSFFKNVLKNRENIRPYNFS